MARSITDPVHLQEPRAAYVHVPFCAHRCGYCDFTLVAGKDHLIDSYLKALETELDNSPIGGGEGQRIELETLYFGGGTPSHLSPQQLRQLFDLVLSRFELSDDCEFTIEANPVDLTIERIDVLCEYGVNRISLGVQSFDDKMLSVLERNHDGETIRDVMERLRGAIDNVSFDLIFGVPGQTLELWDQTLSAAVELGPAHISSYGLTYEKGTSFWSRKNAGDLQSAPEDLEREMYARVMDSLASRGYEQYEISSFALPGRRSRHNQVYWSGKPYLAFGPGAARYVGGFRETNHRSVTTWLQQIQSGGSGTMEREQLDDEDRARERLILGLRLIEGIDIEQFEWETGFSVFELAEQEIDRAVRQGLLDSTDSRLRLTYEGRFFADGVIVDLL